MNETVASKVGPPGIALALFGLGSVAAHLLMGVLTLVSAFPLILDLMGGEGDAQVFFATTGWQLASTAVGFAASLLVTFAGLRLRSARSAGLIYLGAIAAMMPCCVSCCCVIGLPLGIWALVVMQDDGVKAAFAERF